MGYRAPKRRFHLSQVLPIWTPSSSAATNLAFMSLLLRLGITDVESYFRKLFVAIVISVVVCAAVGASGSGLKGLVLGGLLGLVAPAALLWLGVMLVGVAIYLAVYFAAWAVILWGLGWLLFGG